MNKKKVKRILPICLVGLCALATGIGSITYAWFVQQGTKDDVTFTAGLVNYTLTSFLTTGNKIVPGVNIINSTDSVKFTNNSTITTDIRVKIEYTFTDATSKSVGQENIPANDDTTYYKSGTIGDSKSILTLTGGSSSWTATTVGSENWYYATGIAANTDITLFEGTTDSGVSLILDGEKAGNAYEESTLKLTFTFQAKQSEGVTWDTINTYKSFDWTTGLGTK